MKLDPAHLPELKSRHAEHNARLRAKGVTLLTYRAPCCDALVETRPAGPGETWDTLATCPECGTLFAKTTTETEVLALLLEEE